MNDLTLHKQRALAPYQAEADQYARQLEPAAPDEMLKELVRLMAAFPASNGHETATKARLVAYRDVLCDMPIAAIKQACRDWLTSKSNFGDENFSFPPSPPQLRRLAGRAIAATKQRHKQSLAIVAQIERRYHAPTVEELDRRERKVEAALRRFNGGEVSLGDAVGSVIGKAAER